MVKFTIRQLSTRVWMTLIKPIKEQHAAFNNEQNHYHFISAITPIRQNGKQLKVQFMARVMKRQYKLRTTGTCFSLTDSNQRQTTKYPAPDIYMENQSSSGLGQWWNCTTSEQTVNSVADLRTHSALLKALSAWP